MAHPLVARLIELKPTVAVLVPEPDAQPGRTGAQAAPAEPPPPPEPDVETLTAEALAAERARWAAEEGARLAGLLAELTQGVEQRIAATASRVLRPFLDASVRDRALAGLSASLDTILRAKPAATMTLTGPADLGEAFLRRLPAALADKIRFTPGEGVELTLAVDDMVVETQLALWSRALRDPDV